MTPDFNTWKQQLQHPLEWLMELEGTPQDPIWHAEGNVATHTQMVMEQAYSRLGGLQPAQQHLLMMAALLHDIGKSQCTTFEDMPENQQGHILRRYHSRGHPAVGRNYLAGKMWSLLEHPYAALNLVSHQASMYSQLFSLINMVGLHHQPSKLLHQGKQQGSYWHLADQCPIHLLHLLALSDAYGRISATPDTTIDLFAEALEHHSVAPQPYALWAEHMLQQAPNISTAEFWLAEAKRLHRLGRIQSPEQVCAMYHPKQHRISHVVVLCGLSGSGKSRLVQACYPDMLHISLDELRTQIAGQRSNQDHNGQVLQAAYGQLKQALAKKQDVVFDATNLRADFRSKLFALATDYGALCTLELMHTPLELCLKRNKARAHVLPDSVIMRQAQMFEFPYTCEAHRCHFRDDKAQTLLRTGYLSSA